MKSIVCFDLDMTLLDHNAGCIPESALTALELIRPNSYIVLATGRDMDTYYSRQYRDIVRPDAIIHSNGARVTVGDETLYEGIMQKELVADLLKFAEENGLSVGATIKDDDHYTNPENVRRLDIESWGECGRHFKDPWELADMDVRSLAYVGSKEGRDMIEENFPEIKCPTFAGGFGADVMLKVNSKANGLNLLCDHWGIGIADTYAFGDGPNDIEILDAAGTGIAMGNASDDVKASADYVTSDIADDGVYKACEHFHLF